MIGKAGFGSGKHDFGTQRTKFITGQLRIIANGHIGDRGL
jgi:hypothetical protein